MIPRGLGLDEGLCFYQGHWGTFVPVTAALASVAIGLWVSATAVQAGLVRQVLRLLAVLSALVALPHSWSTQASTAHMLVGCLLFTTALLLGTAATFSPSRLGLERSRVSPTGSVSLVVGIAAALGALYWSGQPEGVPDRIPDRLPGRGPRQLFDLAPPRRRVAETSPLRHWGCDRSPSPFRLLSATARLDAFAVGNPGQLRARRTSVNSIRKLGPPWLGPSTNKRTRIPQLARSPRRDPSAAVYRWHMTQPNILLIMTDEERYPPPYETEAVKAFRREQLGARESIRDGALEFHRHYAGSTACVASRATLFTGQYPSLHGVSQTDGTSKKVDDPAMMWLDPDTVPTLGDWFRAGGYKTHYRGKWHVSNAALPIPGSHEGLMASDDNGVPIPEAVEAYRKSDRLDPFGFSGWIGREPHGPAPAESGKVRDGVFAEQVVELFDELAQARGDGPWLAVASFVNPHDICTYGIVWEQLWKFGPPDDSVPEVPAAPSQSDTFDDRPPCQEQWKAAWWQMAYEQPADLAYRRLYYYLHKLVDKAIGRIVEALESSGMADDTMIVFTSDHGDLLGAHGGMQQKWYNGFDEAIRVPLLIKGPGVATSAGGITMPTSHIDLIPTLMGLAGIDPERAMAGVAECHEEAQPLPGRDLSGIITASAGTDAVVSPLYFMTEDDISRGLNETNLLSGKPFDPVAFPSRVESVIATLPTGADGADELWKLNHYYERLDDWNADHGIPKNPFAGPPADPIFELHNLTTDPEEHHNRVDDEPQTLRNLTMLLDDQREAKRMLPAHRNPVA
ncbi:MAG TPA: sulfatase-like hydrolase/transferase [Acidimicrobiales bacterium]|nr:sulfatase-like hydrolase/transferase [Acidimicrobiales bacterium]